MNNTLTKQEKQERQDIIVSVGMKDPAIVDLAKDLVSYVKATSPRIQLSLEGAIFALGEIGIFMSMHDDAAKSLQDETEVYMYDSHDRLLKETISKS